jgi:GcrA cell cycle regulator
MSVVDQPVFFYIAWDAVRDATLARLWAQGLSASQIAKEMGGTTRNAVIGRARRTKLAYRNPHRVGISPWSMSQDDRATKPKPVYRAPKPAKTVSAVRKLLETLPTEPLPARDTAEATVSFNDLENHHCCAITAEHLPFNANAKIYCGERKVLGVSYCETHARRFMTVPDPSAPKKFWSVERGKLASIIKSESLKHQNAKEFSES